jgi:hypothetical protein
MIKNKQGNAISMVFNQQELNNIVGFGFGFFLFSNQKSPCSSWL